MDDIAPTTIDQLIRSAASARPDELALADAPNRASFFGDDPQRLSWSELDAHIDGIGQQLQALGATQGTAVAIQLPNVAELVITILACARLGAVAVPFPIQHRNHELRSGFRVAQVEIVVTAARPDRPDQLDTVAAVMAEFEDTDLAGMTLATFGEATIDGATALSLTAGDPLPPSPAQASDVATVCWTSGTTGVPKGVPRTHEMWHASCQFQVNELAITADDQILCPFPVVNMAGIGGMLLPWAMAGAALHLHQPLDLQVFLGQIQGEKITYTVAPPPLLNMLLRNEALLDSVDLSTIRSISSGSAPLAPWMVKGWQDRGIEIINVFGSNEGAALLSTMAAVPDPTDRAQFFPRPTRPDISIRLVSLETGEDITETGIQGELRFAGATVFAGYLESDGREIDDQGYYCTGDIFQWTGDATPPSLLQFIDRAKDIIIRGGMNISAAEVETLISSHESVAECAAVAYPDPDLGERVGVFVVAAEGATPDLDSLVAHLRDQNVASYKLPERIEVIDQLPRNPVGKVTKPDLRDRWQNATTN